MFENVNYTFYTETMKRSSVPDEATFERFKEQMELRFLKIAQFVTGEAVENGKDKTVCMWIEEAFKAEASGIADGAKLNSESLGGYSRSFDNSALLSYSGKLNNWLSLYCYVDIGVA